MRDLLATIVGISTRDAVEGISVDTPFLLTPGQPPRLIDLAAVKSRRRTKTVTREVEKRGLRGSIWDYGVGRHGSVSRPGLFLTQRCWTIRCAIFSPQFRAYSTNIYVAPL